MRFFQTRRWTATHLSAVKAVKLKRQTRVSNKNDKNDKHQRVLGIMKGNAKNRGFQRISGGWNLFHLVGIQAFCHAGVTGSHSAARGASRGDGWGAVGHSCRTGYWVYLGMFLVLARGVSDIPCSKHLQNYGKIHHFEWENSQTFYGYLQ